MICSYLCRIHTKFIDVHIIYIIIYIWLIVCLRTIKIKGNYASINENKCVAIALLQYIGKYTIGFCTCRTIYYDYVYKKKVVYLNNILIRNVKTSLINHKIPLKKVCTLNLLVNDNNKNVPCRVFGHITR